VNVLNIRLPLWHNRINLPDICQDYIADVPLPCSDVILRNLVFTFLIQFSTSPWSRADMRNPVSLSMDIVGSSFRYKLRITSSGCQDSVRHLFKSASGHARVGRTSGSYDRLYVLGQSVHAGDKGGPTRPERGLGVPLRNGRELA